MWGKVSHIETEPDRPRIIPTRVGKRRLADERDGASRDHPHACGEKRSCRGKSDGAKGSSPRVWGKVVRIWLMQRTCRIIPTRVGKSLLPHCMLPKPRDHPHACGEKYSVFCSPPRLLGSSPRVWGKGGNIPRFMLAGGIIPTRVGKRLKKTVNFKAFYIPKSMFSFSFDRIPYSSKLSSSARCF